MSLQLAAVRTLLAEAQLPASDLTEEHLKTFLWRGKHGRLLAVVGLELYPPVGLLRSLAVSATSRNQGIGSALLVDAERYAREHAVNDLYLLTTTAEKFFASRGYEKIERDDAPAAIRNTQEYSTLCSAASVLMRKRL